MQKLALPLATLILGLGLGVGAVAVADNGSDSDRATASQRDPMLYELRQINRKLNILNRNLTGSADVSAITPIDEQLGQIILNTRP